MQYPMKYIENNLVWNHDGECFAYYELIPYNYSFLSVEQKEAVHDAFRQLTAQNRDGKIHALQISTESSIRAAQERSKAHASGKLREAALRRIDGQTDALVSMIGENQVDYRFYIGFKLLLNEQDSTSLGRQAANLFSGFLRDVNHNLMGDFASMPNDEILRYQKMEKLLESKISCRFKVRRLDKNDFGYLLEHLYGRSGTAYEDYEFHLPKKKLKGETIVKRYDLNTILARAGITLVITVAFSVSTMLYQIADRYPFFIIAFLQVVLFVGTYFKLGDLLSLFSLRDDGTRSMGRHIARRPGMFLYHQLHRLNRSVRSASSKGKTGSSRNTSGRSARDTSGAAYSSQRSGRSNNQSGSSTAGGQPRSLSSSSVRGLPLDGTVGGTDGSPQTDMPSMPESGADMPADTAVHSRPETMSAPTAPTPTPAGTTQMQTGETQRPSAAAAHDRPVVMAISNPDTGQAAKPVAQQQEQPAGASIARRPMVSQHERPATVQQNKAAPQTAAERPAATAEIRRSDTQQRPVVSTETRRPEAGNRPVMQQAEPIKPAAWVQDKPAKPRPAVEQKASVKPETKPAQRKNTVQGKPVVNQPGSAGGKDGAQNGGGKK